MWYKKLIVQESLITLNGDSHLRPQTEGHELEANATV
jgi:hypothetical protein